MAELFERHDRSKVEILGFCFDSDTIDEMRESVSVAMDRFLDVRFMSDREVAQLSRERLIGLTGLFNIAKIQDRAGFPEYQSTQFNGKLCSYHPMRPEGVCRAHGNSK